MSEHIRPIHLIGALSPTDVERLVVRSVEIEARREGEPQSEEPVLGEMTLTTSMNSASGEGPAILDLMARARMAGEGVIKCRFQVVIHFAEGHERSLDDLGSQDVIKDLARPSVRDAVNRVAYLLSATAEIRVRIACRTGLLERLRSWAERRAVEAAR